MYDYNCDVKLQVGTESFRAHREVLSNASDYFAAMFSHDMRERLQDAVALHGISSRGFTLMMEYFYHGHITVDSENIEDILESGCFFHIEWLIQICCDFLVRHLALEHQTVMYLADKYCLGNLQKEIFDFVSEKFLQLAAEPSFLNINFDVLYNLLVENNYIHANESFIFKSVLKWLNFNKEERNKYCVPLLSAIRYPLLEENELKNIPEEIINIEPIGQLVNNALDFHLKPSLQCLSVDETTEVRGAKDTVVLITPVSEMELIQYKIPGEEGFLSEETDTSFLSSVLEFASISVLGNFLFVAGGYDRNTWCSSPAFFRYNPRNRMWAQLSSMNYARVSFCLCAGTDKLFAVTGVNHIVNDGRDSEIILNSVESYLPETNIWCCLPEMPFGCFSCAATTSSDKLYVSGGISDDLEMTIPVASLHLLNKDNGWQSLASMLHARQSHSMIDHNGQLYVFGGYTAGPDMTTFEHCMFNEVYNIEADQWTLLTNSPSTYGHLTGAAVKLDNNIYILGGKDNITQLFTYDITSNDFVAAEFCGEYVLKIAVLRIAFPGFSLD